MSSPDKYYLKVTAGSSYTSHTPVQVNSAKPLRIETSSATIELIVNIRDFRGPPSSNCSSTCSYFENPSRKSARYSINFRVIPKKRISGDAIVLGNDFDQPITEYLPPFFGTALSVVKRVLDPGIDGDPYAQKPHLYGPLLSSINVLKVVKKEPDDQFGTNVIKEGVEGEDAKKLWEKDGIPSDASARSKYFLSKDNRQKFEFEPGWCYEFDFFNGYLDFNDFTLKLPMGISFNILGQVGSKDIPPLRYVLRDREADIPLFHVTLTLCTKDKSEDEKKTNSTTESNEPGESEVD